ncbi:MAG: N-acetylmuramoyl-L-alanine amidase [Cyanobacteria bacterium J06631_2]
MKRFLGVAALTNVLLVGSMMITSLFAQAESPLSIVYPPSQHETIAEKIFFIGTGASDIPVLINGVEVENRSDAGHFAPSLPLKLGENTFLIRQAEEEIKLNITRVSNQPEVPQDFGFAPNSLTPAIDIARMPDEPVCVSAIAPPNTKVSAQIGKSKILLMPQISSVDLPANSAVLTSQAIPKKKSGISHYKGCTVLDVPRSYGKPIFTIEQEGRQITQSGEGEIAILSPKDVRVVEVIANAGVARTGASTSFSRLTPLPKGARARVTGKEGEWLRLDYGAWIKAAETKLVSGNIPPQSIIRGATSRKKRRATEIVFPLQTPVPIEIKQQEDSITLTLHNTTAQTDTIRLDPDPIVKRLDWQQVSPTQIDYTFQLHSRQQWGYELRYEGSNLIFSLRHPPQAWTKKNRKSDRSLNGIKILLDPGHGGNEKGARGATGYPEKKINLIMSRLVKDKLEKLGAKVYLTRDSDQDVSLQDRVAMIDKIKPDLALSIHYNALPDSGDAENTQGISTFWYNTQAHAPAMFLHNYLVRELNRSDAGTFWNNLALTRPHTAPAVLLELGYMINPEEFEWITDESEQEKLAETLTKGIEEWFMTVESRQIEQDAMSDRF